MTIKEAATEVLRAAGKPLHATKITEQMLAKGLWQTEGKTPDRAVTSRIVVDIKSKGKNSPFVRTAPRTYGLREWGLKPPGSGSRGKAKTLSFTNAAEKILASFGSKKPMHYRAITEKALEMGLVKTEGKTPESTMYVQIRNETKRSKIRGKQPRFVLHGKGLISLGQWMGKGLAFEIEKYNRQVRQQLHKRLLGMDPTEFEELVGVLLAEMGFEEIEVTKRSSDGGIDVRGLLVIGEVIKTRMAIQVKRWKKGHNVRSPVVQQVRGSLGTHEQGLIVTTSDFSPGAKKEAQRPNAVPVALMNGEQLVGLLVENEIGVSRQPYDLLDLASENPG